MNSAADFVPTRWSVVARAGGADDRQASAALAWLVERYWDPLCRAAQRWGCSQHDAEDAVQDFCCRLVERRLDLGTVRADRGRFRAWLLVTFRNAVRDHQDARQAQKRGGLAQVVDAHAAEPAAPTAADPAFDRDWAEAVLARTADRLASEHTTPSDQLRFSLLKPYLTANADGASYQRIGQHLGLSEGAVKVAVHRLRQRLRELARLEIADTLIDPTPEDIDAELATLASALAADSP